MKKIKFTLIFLTSWKSILSIKEPRFGITRVSFELLSSYTD